MTGSDGRAHEPLSDEQALEILFAYYRAQFPRRCSCGKSYTSLEQWVAETTPVGEPVSYDTGVETGDQPPFSVFGFVNCPCGSTLGMGTQNLGIADHNRLVAWATMRMRATGLTQTQFFIDLRRKLRRRAIERGASGEPRGRRA